MGQSCSQGLAEARTVSAPYNIHQYVQTVELEIFGQLKVPFDIK